MTPSEAWICAGRYTGAIMNADFEWRLFMTPRNTKDSISLTRPQAGVVLTSVAAYFGEGEP